MVALTPKTCTSIKYEPGMGIDYTFRACIRFHFEPPRKHASFLGEGPITFSLQLNSHVFFQSADNDRQGNILPAVYSSRYEQELALWWWIFVTAVVNCCVRRWEAQKSNAILLIAVTQRFFYFFTSHTVFFPRFFVLQSRSVFFFFVVTQIHLFLKSRTALMCFARFL